MTGLGSFVGPFIETFYNPGVNQQGTDFGVPTADLVTTYKPLFVAPMAGHIVGISGCRSSA